MQEGKMILSTHYKVRIPENLFSFAVRHLAEILNEAVLRLAVSFALSFSFRSALPVLDDAGLRLTQVNCVNCGCN